MQPLTLQLACVYIVANIIKTFKKIQLYGKLIDKNRPLYKKNI